VSITEALLRPMLAAAPGRPLITHYDDDAGTRVELSVATLANWVAKTANWLTAEHDVEPGTPIAVQLPPHWQTAGILLGAWWCGAHIVPDPTAAALTFLPPNGSAPGAPLVAIASLDPMGRDLGPASETLDYIAESRLHPDDYLPLISVPGNTPALAGSTVDEVLATARTQATTLGLTPTSRLLTTQDTTFPTTLLTVLSARASLVQITHPDPTKLPTHRTTARTTHQLG
jgi:uncharacterized protein (TIGR03089 family)